MCLPLSGILDLVSKTTAGIESAVDGGLCKANDEKRRYSRAFYKEEGMFRAYSEINAKLYSKLRSKSMVSEKAKPLTCADDVYYGALKLGKNNIVDDDIFDAQILMLSERYLMVLSKDLGVEWMVETDDLVTPTSNKPNPFLYEDKLFVNYTDSASRVAKVKELVFRDEAKARAAQYLF